MFELFIKHKLVRVFNILALKQEREREMFYLMMHSTHFIYGYMASDIWLRTILIVTNEREREMFYLMMHSTHFIYGYMASDLWLRTILIVRKETRCRHIGYSFRLAARVLLYAPSHRQDSTYHGLCYTNRGALAGTRNSFERRRKKEADITWLEFWEWVYGKILLFYQSAIGISNQQMSRYGGGGKECTKVRGQDIVRRNIFSI